MADTAINQCQCDWCWRYFGFATRTARALHKAQDKGGWRRHVDGSLVCPDCVKKKENGEM